MKKNIHFKPSISLFVLLTFSMIINAQWTQQTSGTNQDFWSVHFANENVGYAGGGPWQFTSNAIIAKTVDGGETWETQNPVTFASCIFGINSINPDTIFAVGCNASYYYGLILRSFDGGENWTSTNISNTWGFYCIEFPTESVGYTCGWNGRIYKTEDTGETWTSLTTGSSQTFRRMHFLDENTGFAACGSDHASTNKIYKTTDGTSWSLITNFANSFVIGGMHFFDESTGIVVGTDGNKAMIKRTIDGGENWEDVLSDNYSFVLESLSFNGETGWAAGKYGSNNAILNSEDSGLTWSLNYDELVGTPYSAFQLDSSAYIVGTSGMIFKYEGTTTSTIDKTENNNPLVYPCPVNKILNIDLTQIKGSSIYNIYNINGNCVFSGTGNETISKINVENWTSGIYIFKAWGNQNVNQYSNKIIKTN